MTTFQQDLKDGEYFEIQFTQLANITNYEKVEGLFKPYDIKNLDDEMKYEVKTDKRTAETNNICIEFACNGDDSGIEKTESDYYVYFVRDTTNSTNKYAYHYYYLIPTKVIKEYIKLNNHRMKPYRGGDGNRSQFYLIKENKFIKYRHL